MPTQRPSLGLAPALPGIVLVIVIAWALAAVLMLTGTLINAREINDTVGVINSQVSPIEKDLRYVALAARTVEISGRINAAAQPLSGQANQILGAANRINATARSILNTAGTINQTVRQINTTVRSIQGNVISISGAVAAIGGNVGSIFGRVQSIGGQVASIRRLVGPQNARDQSINANVARISGTFNRLEPLVRGIYTQNVTGGVFAINVRGDRLISTVAPIKSDFVGILQQVGSGNPAAGHGATIHGHANSIDCAPLLNSQQQPLPLNQIFGILGGAFANPFAAPAGGPTNYCNQ